MWKVGLHLSPHMLLQFNDYHVILLLLKRYLLFNVVSWSIFIIICLYQKLIYIYCIRFPNMYFFLCNIYRDESAVFVFNSCF
ncbi:hypothetical protein FKM82_009132 [Ascaphus truei]